MRILQVNTADEAGGAERVMMSLHGLWSELGHSSDVAVGVRRGTDQHVRQLSGSSTVRRVGRRLQELSAGAQRRGWPQLARVFHSLAQCTRPDLLLGHEDFGCNGVREILSAAPKAPDVLQLHNLHGGYFNLSSLPAICERLPVVITLHDAWLFSGHCAHGIDCDRWRTGCGDCPDLSIYPAIRRDATASNWKRKAKTFARCQLNVITPCRWLLDRARQSLIWPSVVQHVVIPNGVNLNIFRPGQRLAARREIGIPDELPVVMFAANGIRANPFKDFVTLRACLELLGAALQKPLLALAIGDSPRTEQIGSVTLRFVDYQQDIKSMARFYAAADLYLHLAKVDTFPTTVIEAMATGLPVVASDVGGIAEQVRCAWLPRNDRESDLPTGLLVPAGRPDLAMVAVRSLLEQKTLNHELGRNGRTVAEQEYCVRQQAQRYLAFYRSILH
jgi:glycosyltransferase involved in cell wall biosynthesis